MSSSDVDYDYRHYLLNFVKNKVYQEFQSNSSHDHMLSTFSVLAAWAMLVLVRMAVTVAVAVILSRSRNGKRCTCPLLQFLHG